MTETVAAILSNIAESYCSNSSCSSSSSCSAVASGPGTELKGDAVVGLHAEFGHAKERERHTDADDVDEGGRR